MWFGKEKNAGKVVVFQVEKDKKMKELSRELRQNKKLLARENHAENCYDPEGRYDRLVQKYRKVIATSQDLLQNPSKIIVPGYKDSNELGQKRVTAYDGYNEGVLDALTLYQNRPVIKIFGLRLN
jgi:hypothetical protein